MRPVNLLPARYRPRAGGSGDPKTAYVVLGALALLVLAVFGYVTTANKVSERNSEIAEVRQQTAAAQAQAVTLKAFGNFASIKETRLAAVRSLAIARTDWERIFRELAHVLPQGVWLTGFQSQGVAVDGGGELGPTMVLKGCAGSHAEIADVMVRLRELHLAADVELAKTTASTDEEGDVAAVPASGAASTSSGGDDCGSYYTFEINVTMESPAAGAQAPGPEVPARLGGGE